MHTIEEKFSPKVYEVLKLDCIEVKTSKEKRQKIKYIQGFSGGGGGVDGIAKPTK